MPRCSLNFRWNASSFPATFTALLRNRFVKIVCTFRGSLSAANRSLVLALHSHRGPGTRFISELRKLYFPIATDRTSELSSVMAETSASRGATTVG